MRSTDGFAELYWICPYKTCEANNCTDPQEQDVNGYSICCHCKRQIKVNY